MSDEERDSGPGAGVKGAQKEAEAAAREAEQRSHQH